MRFYYLGQPIDQLPELTAQTPPFQVDGIIVTDETKLAEASLRLLATYRRHGRPVGSSPAEIAGKARSNYVPIDCNFYDNFEAAIVQRRRIDLAYRQADGTIKHEATRLQDLKTHLTEEYVQLASGEWLRLDRIVSVDGAVAGASCRF